MLTFKGVPSHGPRPRYSDHDIYWTMHLMSGSARIGRKALCYELNLGEGSVRNMLSVLDSCEIIDTYQTGSILTKVGHELFDAIPITPVDIDVPEIIPGRHHFSVVVRGMGRDITNGMKERDVGVRSGGLGCTTLVLRDGHLIMPPDWDLDRESPEYSEYIRSRDIMRPGDALIIGSADDIHTARSSAVNAALNLIRPEGGTQT